jgi:hypothetical protein
MVLSGNLYAASPAVPKETYTMTGLIVPTKIESVSDLLKHISPTCKIPCGKVCQPDCSLLKSSLTRSQLADVSLQFKRLIHLHRDPNAIVIQWYLPKRFFLAATWGHQDLHPTMFVVDADRNGKVVKLLDKKLKDWRAMPIEALLEAFDSRKI